MKNISRSYDTYDYANHSSGDHNSETDVILDPIYGWRVMGPKIDKS